jgi:hypothetical protein
MTRPLTEDDLLEFKRLVRWLTGVTLTQVDAARELAAIEARYTAPDPELSPAPDVIRWTGGKNPVPGKNVQVELWGGDISIRNRSEDLRWNHTTARTGDIVAYRVVE